MTSTLWFLYVLTALLGLVPGGVAGSFWAAATGETPRIGILHRIDFLTPLKVVALCLYAPLGIVRTGLWYIEFNPIVSILLLGLGLGWSFLEGVFILTTWFGFT